MEGAPWYEISNDAKDLIKQMLTVDPLYRITLDGILDHPWIKKVGDSCALSKLLNVCDVVSKFVFMCYLMYQTL